jgi:hypothetical protein
VSATEQAKPAPASAPARRCLNCGEDFAAWRPDRQPRFCPACGQETNVRAPRIGEFIQQFGGAYFATEGAMWRTLRLLLFKPGELTARYLAGQRKHYVLPLRLYLTISLMILLLLRASATLQLEVPPETAAKATEAAAHNLNMNFGGGRAGLKEGVFFCQDLPPWLCKRIQRRIDIDHKAWRGAVEQLQERFFANLGGALFVLLPSFALWLKIAYFNRRLRYTEHLVFALHLHAFWFVALGLTLAGQTWLTLPALLAVPVYTLMAMKRVYGGRRWPRLLRAATVAMLYGVTLVMALVGVGVWSALA